MLAMARRTRKKSQFQVELDSLMREVELEDKDCAATATHQLTEGSETVGNCKLSGKHLLV